MWVVAASAPATDDTCRAGRVGSVVAEVAMVAVAAAATVVVPQVDTRVITVTGKAMV